MGNTASCQSVFIDSQRPFPNNCSVISRQYSKISTWLAVDLIIKMITLTELAANKIKSLLIGKIETGIRAAVRGGGCSGFTYKLEFDNQKEEDRVVKSHGVNIYIDWDII